MERIARQIRRANQAEGGMTKVTVMCQDCQRSKSRTIYQLGNGYILALCWPCHAKRVKQQSLSEER
jgi:hypothetical protein